MAEFTGVGMVLTWTYSGGTVSLNGDYRTCDWTPTITYEDVTAGNDTQVGRITTLKDATANVSLVAQAGGTALVAAFVPGQAGTLVIQPEGTAVNKRKITLPAYCDGIQTSMPYANVVTYTIGFSGSSTLAAYSDAVNT
jgi:hypothetical protein